MKEEDERRRGKKKRERMKDCDVSLFPKTMRELLTLLNEWTNGWNGNGSSINQSNNQTGTAQGDAKAVQQVQDHTRPSQPTL